MYDNLKKASNLFIIFGIISSLLTFFLWFSLEIDAPEISRNDFVNACFDFFVNLYLAVIPFLFFSLSKIFRTLAEDLQAQNITSEERLQKIKAELLKEIEAKAGQN